VRRFEWRHSEKRVFVADRYLATVKMIEPIEGLSPVGFPDVFICWS